MTSLFHDYAKSVLSGHEPPCLSLYQPTHRHHPENRQDSIRFGNLLKSMEQSLRQAYPDADVRRHLEPFRALAANTEFWNHTGDGLAAFGATGFFRVYNLRTPVRELAVVADSFHTKPLARIAQTADRYQVLGLNRHEAKLFEGNRYGLDEIELAVGVPRTITEALGDQLTEPHQTVASYGMGAAGAGSAMHHGHGSKKDEVDLDAERFFRAIDRAVLEHHSRPSGMPLMLAALPEHHALFRSVSHNPFLMGAGLDVHPDSLPRDALGERAWGLARPGHEAKLAAISESYREARSKEHGTDSLSEAAVAAANGRVGTLLVEADRQIPGRLDRASGGIEAADASHPEVDDLLDDLAALAVERGAEVVVVPHAGMPTDTGVAAIYRY